jgi:hypothetical protein
MCTRNIEPAPVTLAGARRASFGLASTKQEEKP